MKGEKIIDKENFAYLKYLIDLRQETVNIEVSSCFEYVYPTEAMNWLCVILKYLQKNSEYFYKISKMDMSVLGSLIQKLEENEKWLNEFDGYIRYANKKLKKDKGWPENDVASVGLPREVLNITLEELVIFYKCLEILEKDYHYIKEQHGILWSIERYFKYIDNIKNMLNERLAYKVINEYTSRNLRG